MGVMASSAVYQHPKSQTKESTVITLTSQVYQIQKIGEKSQLGSSYRVNLSHKRKGQE